MSIVMVGTLVGGHRAGSSSPAGAFRLPRQAGRADPRRARCIMRCRLTHGSAPTGPTRPEPSSIPRPHPPHGGRPARCWSTRRPANRPGAARACSDARRRRTRAAVDADRLAVVVGDDDQPLDPELSQRVSPGRVHDRGGQALAAVVGVRLDGLVAGDAGVGDEDRRRADTSSSSTNAAEALADAPLDEVALLGVLADGRRSMNVASLGLRVEVVGRAAPAAPSRRRSRAAARRRRRRRRGALERAGCRQHDADVDLQPGLDERPAARPSGPRCRRSRCSRARPRGTRCGRRRSPRAPLRGTGAT